MVSCDMLESYSIYGQAILDQFDTFNMRPKCLLQTGSLVFELRNNESEPIEPFIFINIFVISSNLDQNYPLIYTVYIFLA